MDDYIYAAYICVVIAIVGLFVWLFGGAARMGEEVNDDVDVDEHESMIDEPLEQSIKEFEEAVEERRRMEFYND